MSITGQSERPIQEHCILFSSYRTYKQDRKEWSHSGINPAWWCTRKSWDQKSFLLNCYASCDERLRKILLNYTQHSTTVCPISWLSNTVALLLILSPTVRVYVQLYKHNPVHPNLDLWDLSILQCTVYLYAEEAEKDESRINFPDRMVSDPFESRVCSINGDQGCGRGRSY